MRRLLVPLVLLVCATLNAQSPAEQELERLLATEGERRIVDLRLSELDRALGLVSIARRQREHLERSTMLSWVAPGLGHYVNGATGEAWVFAAADIATGAATLILGTWLLPPAVQHRNLNYLQSSFETIETRWKSLTPSELIPVAAISVTGSLLSLTIRHLAARSARVAALTAIRDGVVTFRPEPLGGVGFGPF